MPDPTQPLSRGSSCSSTLSSTDGYTLSSFGRAAPLSADAYRVSGTVPSRTPSLTRTVTRDASLGSTQSTLGLLTPCGSQTSEDGGDGHWYTYGEEHALAHLGEESMGFGQPELHMDAEEVLGAALGLRAWHSSSSVTTEGGDAEVSDMDTDDSGSDTETETETETEKGERTPSNSLRAISRHSTLSGAAFEVAETDLYPAHQQRGTPLPRAAWSSTRDYIVVNGGAGVAVSDLILAEAAAPALQTQAGLGTSSSPSSADDPAGADRADPGDALLSTHFGTNAFFTELHWPDRAVASWLYAAGPTTTCRRYFYFIVTMLKLWLKTRRADTQDTNLAVVPDLEDIQSSARTFGLRPELDDTSVERMLLYGLRCVGMGTRGHARWVLDVNVV